MVEDPAGDRAEQRALDRSATTRAHHRQLRPLRRLREHRGRIADDHRGGDRQTRELLAERIRLRRERGLELLLPTVGDVGAELELGLPVEPLLAGGQDGDDLESGLPRGGHLGGGEHRDPRGLRTVDGDDDRSAGLAALC